MGWPSLGCGSLRPLTTIVLGSEELPELGRGLGVELDPPGVLPVDAERLVRCELARRQHLRAGRRLEDVVVPLVDAGGRLEEPEDRIVRRRGSRADLEPPDLTLRGLLHVAAEGPREELRPEADPEDGDVLLDRVLEEHAFRPEQRHAVLIPGVGVPAHGDECGEVVEVDVVEPLVPGTQAPVRKPRSVEPLAEKPEPSQRVLLLDDEDRPHRRGR